MNRFLSYGGQVIEDDDVAAVVAALKSDYLTCGPEVVAFEKEFAAFVGAKYAFSFANATGALHIAMLAAGIGKGDRVLTSPLTFLSSANCAAFVGATPDFVDVCPVSRNMDPQALESMMTDDVKAVIPVDLGGLTPNMPEIAAIARRRGAWVIEDACHATGGGFTYEGRTWKTGGHPWADMTIFSFHPVKTLTTAEGGMITTNNDELAALIGKLRAHGIERNSEAWVGLGSDEPAYQERGPWYYEMQVLGYNYRLTDIQCALGRTQLAKLERFMRRRREIVARYNAAFGDPARQNGRGLDWIKTPACPSPACEDEVSWHLYSLEIDFEALGMTRTEVMNTLRAKNIGTQVLYIPVHLQPYYRETYAYAPGKCPNAEAIYPRLLSLPLTPSLTDEEVDYVIQNVLALGS